MVRAVEHAPTLATRHAVRAWRRWLRLTTTSRRALALENRRVIRAALARWGANARTRASNTERSKRAAAGVIYCSSMRGIASEQCSVSCRTQQASGGVVPSSMPCVDGAWSRTSRRASTTRQRAAMLSARVALSGLLQMLLVHEGARGASAAVIDRRRGAAALSHWAKRCAGRRAFRAASKIFARGAAHRAIAAWRVSAHQSRARSKLLRSARRRLLRVRVVQALTRLRAAVARRRVEVLRSAVLQRRSHRSAGRWALRRLGKHLKHQAAPRELSLRSYARVAGEAVRRWRTTTRVRVQERRRVAAFVAALARRRRVALVRAWATRALLVRRKASLATMQGAFYARRLLLRAWRGLRPGANHCWASPQRARELYSTDRVLRCPPHSARLGCSRSSRDRRSQFCDHMCCYVGPIKGPPSTAAVAGPRSEAHGVQAARRARCTAPSPALSAVCRAALEPLGAP